MEYGDMTFSFMNPKVISGVGILLVSLFVFFKKIKINPTISFSLGWFFIALLPVTNVYRINSSYMMEHWLYLPEMGFFLLCAYVFCHFYRKKKLKLISIIFMTGLLGWYIFLTARQNCYWHDDIKFYERILSYKPNSPRIYYNLGIVYASLGRNDDSIRMYQKAIELDPNYFLAHNNMAVMYYYNKQYGLAIDHVDLATQIGYEANQEFLNLLKPYRQRK
jgi:protein O-mannosyl-transferase